MARTNSGSAGENSMHSTSACGRLCRALQLPQVVRTTTAKGAAAPRRGLAHRRSAARAPSASVRRRLNCLHTLNNRTHILSFVAVQFPATLVMLVTCLPFARFCVMSAQQSAQQHARAWFGIVSAAVANCAGRLPSASCGCRAYTDTPPSSQ